MAKLISKVISCSLVLASISGVAAAEGSVKLGGSMDSKFVSKTQRAVYKTGTADYNDKNSQMVTDAELSVSATGETDSGITYGADTLLDLVGNTTDSSDRLARFKYANVNAKNDALGKIVVGGTKSAAETMHISAPSDFATGGSINGATTDHVNGSVGVYTAIDPRVSTSAVSSTNYESVSYMTSAHMLGDESTSRRFSNKIAYYSPEFNGAQFGLSFTPDNQDDSNHDGASSKYVTTSTSTTASSYFPHYSKNIITAGLTYKYQPSDEMFVKGSLVGETGTPKDASGTVTYRQHKLKTMALGASVGYRNFTVGGSFYHFGKSYNLKTIDSSVTNYAAFNYRNDVNTKAFALGATYVQGPIVAGVNSFSSKQNRNKFRNVSVGLEYRLAGFAPYMEMSSFKYAAAKTYTQQSGASTSSVQNNKGNVFFVGAKVNF